MKAPTVLPGWECSIAVPEMTARYGAVLINPEGMMRGVSETGILRRYGVEVLGDVGTGGWFVRMGDVGSVMGRIDCGGGCWVMREYDLQCILDRDT